MSTKLQRQLAERVRDAFDSVIDIIDTADLSDLAEARAIGLTIADELEKAAQRTRESALSSDH